MPTIKTMEEAVRAANDKQQYRGLNDKEIEAQKARTRMIGNLLNKAKICRMADA